MAMATACRRGDRELFLTSFNGEHGLSVRYPASWKTEQTEQDGVWYRYFLGPPSGPDRKPAVSVTALAGPLPAALDDYAQTYLAGNTLQSSREESRQGAKGRSYAFASSDGKTRYSLLLLGEPGKVYGLYAQGDAVSFAAHARELDEMTTSFGLERAEAYPEHRDDKFGFSLRVPPSWRESRRFSGGGTLLLQYTSPALGADRGGQTVHASLTVTVEPIGGDGDLDTLYQDTRRKLGGAFQIMGHAAWKGGGYVDVMRSETPVAVSRVKRYYRADQGRGYCLAFESRDDAYPRVFRWYDVIASTLKTASELKPR